MENKKKILIGAVVALAAIVFIKMKSGAKSVSEKLGDLFNSQATDAQDAVEVTVYDEAKTEYNVARQKYYSLVSKYPPESWTIEQIEEATKNWSAIKTALVNYQSYMSKMGLSSTGNAKAASCYDLSTAQQLEASAKASYDVYVEKKEVYDQIVSICKQYGISAADLGVKDINSDSFTTLSNALTKAESLGKLKSVYDELVSVCAKFNSQVSLYVGTEKWYNLTLSKLNSAKSLAMTNYDTWCDSEARQLVFLALKDLIPIAAPSSYQDPTSVGWCGNAKNASNLPAFRDRPYESQFNLDSSVWDRIARECKDDTLCRKFNSVFASCPVDYPAFRCQMKKNWPYVSSVSEILSNDGSGGGVKHIGGRGGYNTLANYRNSGVQPFC